MITDAALASLVRYPGLMYLALDENPLHTDDGVRHLRHQTEPRTEKLLTEK